MTFDIFSIEPSPSSLLSCEDESCLQNNMPLMNIGEECNTQFGCENGPCPSCGVEGLCCKKGIKRCGCNGISGGENRYECTDITGIESLIVRQNRYIHIISNFDPNQYK